MKPFRSVLIFFAFWGIAFMGLVGCSGSGSNSGGGGSNTPTASAPTFSPTPGTFTTAQSVTISDTTTGATIYYTTDGSTPNTASKTYSAPISVNVDTTINAIAVATGYNNSTEASGKFLLAGPAVNVTISNHDQSALLSNQTATLFTLTTSNTNPVVVDETQTFQPIDGFGAAFTDSAAWLLYTQAQTAEYTSTMNDLFTRSGNGIGLNFMRIPMGASDIARSVYSFDDLASGQTDPTLATFSIAHDQTYVLPVIQQARTLNPDLVLLANPWSPPGWMKTTNSMIGGNLNSTYYSAWANYFVDYLKAYKAAGVSIDYITPQNEPLYIPSGYPGMGVSASVELPLVRDYLLPALTTNNLSTKIMVYDHNWDTPSYPELILADSTVAASSQIAGTAWHGYGGTPGAQQTVANMFPSKGTWQTEHSGGTWVSDQFTADFEEITQVLRNSGRAYVKWSLALDQTLGPNLPEENSSYGGCTTCTPLVTVNSTTGAVTKDIEYYTLGQYSKFVLPGATRIYSSNANGILSAAFINPDASKALVCFNDTSSSQTFQVQWGVQNLSYTLPAHGAVTFTWSGTQSGTSAIPATNQIQASSYSAISGMETEETSDTGGGFDIGYVTNNSYLEFQNVDFGTGVTQVSVRSASGGSGGTITFHLDSLTGPTIATVTLPVTGGWQTWTTATGTASGATGVHTLYAVVSSSSSSISNLNWFKFQ